MEHTYTKGILASKNELSPDIMEFWIVAPKIAAQAVPGQFVALYCQDGSRLLPRPISICDIDEEKQKVRLVFRLAGNGTRELAATKVFDSITIMGPLGNGYSQTDCSRPMLIGGGIGIPPMLYLAKELKKQGKDVTVVLGYRTNDLFLADEFAEVATLYIATDDGSVGTKGTVVDAIRENGPVCDWIGSCGPMPMLRGVKAYAAEQSVPAFISLEERMACGIGACLGCVCKTKKENHHTHVNNARICVEGPVFGAEEVEI